MDYRTINLNVSANTAGTPQDLLYEHLKVSAVGLGTVKLGRNQGVRYPTPFDLPDDSSVAKLLAIAHDELGINLIDTAPAYGSSESRLGQLLPGNRDQWVIMTKAGEQFDNGIPNYDFSPDAIRNSVEHSLINLRIDHLDIVLIHAGKDDKAPIERDGALQVLTDLRQAGKIRAIGSSSRTIEGGMLAIEHGSDVLMVEYNPTNTSQLPLLEYAAHHGVSVVIKKALVSGHLNRVGGNAHEENAAAACVRFALDAPAVASVIVGTINPDHLREACQGIHSQQ